MCKRHEWISASIFKKWGGLKRKCVKNIFSELDCAKNETLYWSWVALRKFRQPNIVPIPTKQSAVRSCYTKDTDKYIQEDYHVFVSQVHICHMNYGHLMRRKYILKCTTSIVCNANTLYLLIAYLWWSWKYMKVIKKTWLVLLKLSLWSAGLTLGALINYPAQLCRTGYQPTGFRITHCCNILLLQ